MEDLAVQIIENSTKFDLMVAAKVKAVLLNDTGLMALWTSMYSLIQKMSLIESSTTPSPLFTTTTSNYLNSNVNQNNKINNLLNQLIELQVKHNIQYKKLLDSKKPIEQLTFSSDPDVDTKIKDVFTSLSFLSKVHNISFKDFYLKLN